MRLAVPIPIDLPLQITCYVADAQAASMMERALEAPGSAWGPEVLGMPNTTFAWCNLRLLDVETGPMYKKISFRSVPKPGPGNRAGFFIARTRLKSRYAANAAPCHLVERGGRARERRQAAGGAHDCARQGAPLRPLLLRFVEALNTPVVGPVMGLFGGRRDSLFVNPFK
jgi:hypothetical protein